MSRLIATFFYIGYLRPAPGTWGSAAACVAAIPLLTLGGVWALALGAVAAFWIGLWATEREAGPEDHDPSRIVIDEVAGQWVTLLPLAWFYHATDRPGAILWGGLAIGFLLFRLFDIWKPWPVTWADRREDALGVMLDDVLAGLLAASVMIVGLLALAYAAVSAVYG
ncbi:MAG: phosphatidylglycerophosphatase A [Pseudomonadota bacterium]